MNLGEYARDLSRRLQEAYAKMNNEIVEVEKLFIELNIPAVSHPLSGGGFVEWSGVKLIFLDEAGRRTPLLNSPKDVRIDALHALNRCMNPAKPETDAMRWLLVPVKTKKLADIRLADVPRGLSPEDIAIDAPKK